MKGKILGLVVLCGGIIALGSTAVAGIKNTTATVSITGGNFSGALGVTRNSANNVEYIGCWNNGNGVASCSARNAAGTFASCSTSNAGHLAAIRSFIGDSNININHSNGTCTSLSVWNYSDYSPKNH